MQATAEEERIGAGAARDRPNAWGAFAQAVGREQISHAWLALLAEETGRPTTGLTLFRDSSEGVFIPAAIFPDVTTDVGFLASVAQQALQEKQPVIVPPHDAGGSPDGAGRCHQFALPILLGRTPVGAVAVAVEGLDGVTAESVLAQMQLGAGWLTNLALQEQDQALRARLAREVLALDQLLVTLERPELQEAALCLVSTLAVKLELKQASLGLLTSGGVRLRAISHTAHFRRQSEAVKALEAAMEEALDQDQDILVPESVRTTPGNAPRPITCAHRDLLDIRTASAIGTFVLRHQERAIGALTFEWGDPVPSAHELHSLGAALAGAIAPVLAGKLEQDRWITGPWRARVAAWVMAAAGPERPLIKVTFALLILTVLLSLVLPADYRITAKAVIEGAVQRAAVAPFDGYLRQALVRPGDSVKGHDLIAVLDQRDLLLERLSLESKRDQSERKYREAWAKHDRAGTSVLGAELRQVEAQLDLVRQKLVQTEIRAPLDGIVIAGDLSQRLGSPVKQGETLFEVAPTDRYRLVLKVDQRDIVQVTEGQHGRVVMASFTAEPLPFVIKKITPVATAEEGLNYFRVEAQVEAPGGRFHPGMGGVGKIEAGRRSLWWIWTHRATDWIVLALWRWLA